MLQVIKFNSREDKDVTQSVKAAGFDDHVSDQAMQAIRRWGFGGPIKLCLLNRHEPAAKVVAKLNRERYQVQSRSATEELRKGCFRLPPGSPEVLFITGKAWSGLPKPEKRTLVMSGIWQTAIVIFLQGDAEGGLFGGRGKAPNLRMITDRISGVYVDGGPITCASFAERVSHPQGRHHVQQLVVMLSHLAQTSGFSTEDLDVRQLSPDHLVERCLSRKRNRYELQSQLPSTYAITQLAANGNYDRYLDSQVWRDFATEFKELAAGACELCGNASMLSRENEVIVHYEVHHLVYPGVLGREREVPYALAKVCDRCHNLLESLKHTSRESYNRLCYMCGCE